MLYLDDQAKSQATAPNTELIRRKKHRQMDRLRRTLSFRSRKKGNTANNTDNNHSSTATAITKNGNNVPATTTITTSTTTTAENKPLQWQDDEKSVRAGACSFNVKVKATT